MTNDYDKHLEQLEELGLKYFDKFKIIPDRYSNIFGTDAGMYLTKNNIFKFIPLSSDFNVPLNVFEDLMIKTQSKILDDMDLDKD